MMRSIAHTKAMQWLLNSCVELIGFIELLIGLTTVLFVTLFDLFSVVEKPLSVFIFVTLSSVISAVIGFGILRYKNWARILLVFFSGYVIILKILIYLGIVQFSGEIITVPPSYIKDFVSILYHAFIIIILNNKDIISKFTTAK
ncbi:hypothetical protein OAA99_01400 [Omnitrophica bacterium]|nr:hypothetical protein [Candidatus Omnitrophota bacterium]